MAGRDDPRRHHAEAECLRRYRRRDRRRHHLDSGSAAQRPQLGLPLLLAARRLLRGERLEPPGRDRYDGALPAIHPERDRRHPRCAAAAGVRHSARGSAGRARNAGAGRLSRHGAGAHRQPGLLPGAKRCVRLGHPGRHACLFRHAAGAAGGPPAVRGSGAAGRAGGAELQRAGRRHLGIARRAPGAHLFQRHVLGRLRPSEQHRAPAGPAAARRKMGSARTPAFTRKFATPPGIRSSAVSSRPSMASTWTPACC